MRISVILIFFCGFCNMERSNFYVNPFCSSDIRTPDTYNQAACGINDSVTPANLFLINLNFFM